MFSYLSFFSFREERSLFFLFGREKMPITMVSVSFRVSEYVRHSS
jgi:hypothetical protein